MEIKMAIYGCTCGCNANMRWLPADISLVRQDEWAPIDWFEKLVAVCICMAGDLLTRRLIGRAENQY